jgi:toxin ParE1/3/4
MRARLLPEADHEFSEIAQWYENLRQGLGEQFISESIDAFLAIEQHPRRFSKCRYRSSHELRQCRLVHFPHAVIYEVLENECTVIAIAHPARRPNYWRDRLK